MVFSVFRQKSFGLCLLLSVTCLLGVGTASAQQVGPGCDPAFIKIFLGHLAYPLETIQQVVLTPLLFRAP
jgi:hypothetical protein